jgi:hypothetical protein
MTKTQEEYKDYIVVNKDFVIIGALKHILQEQEEELRKGFADWDNDIICMDCGFVTHSSRDMVEHMSNYGGERSSSENCDIVKIENLNSPQKETLSGDLLGSRQGAIVTSPSNAIANEDKPNPSSYTSCSKKGSVLCSKGCGERLVSTDDWHKCSRSKFCEEKT